VEHYYFLYQQQKEMKIHNCSAIAAHKAVCYATCRASFCSTKRNTVDMVLNAVFGAVMENVQKKYDKKCLVPET
jgi:hypothetical protein